MMPVSESSPIDEASCPFCGEDNRCGARKHEPCWCCDLEVPEELRALVPPELAMQACICRSCIASFASDPDRFKKKRDTI